MSEEIKNCSEQFCLLANGHSGEHRITQESYWKYEIDRLKVENEALKKNDSLVCRENDRLEAALKVAREALGNSLVIYKASNKPQELWEGWVDKFHEKVEKALALIDGAEGKAKN